MFAGLQARRLYHSNWGENTGTPVFACRALTGCSLVLLAFDDQGSRQRNIEYAHIDF